MEDSSNCEVLYGPFGSWNTDPFGIHGDISIAAVRRPSRLMASKSQIQYVRHSTKGALTTGFHLKSNRFAQGVGAGGPGGGGGGAVHDPPEVGGARARFLRRGGTVVVAAGVGRLRANRARDARGVSAGSRAEPRGGAEPLGRRPRRRVSEGHGRQKGFTPSDPRLVGTPSTRFFRTRGRRRERLHTRERTRGVDDDVRRAVTCVPRASACADASARTRPLVAPSRPDFNSKCGGSRFATSLPAKRRS